MRNPIATTLLIVLILVILSDGVAALLAARVCWRLRHRAKLALPFAIVLGVLAFVSLNDVVNSTVNLQGVNVPKAYLIQAFIGRGLKAGATWYLALKLLNGSEQGRTVSATDIPKPMK